MKISEKDWKRMQDLVLTGKDGVGTAAVIKSKDKAIARFVAGIKLKNSNLDINSPTYGNNYFHGHFAEFGNKAMELGATLEEIQETYNTNQVPEKYHVDRTHIKEKKLDSRFVGDLSKKLLDKGFSVEFYDERGYRSGYAITHTGIEAMEKNGRKWTIGYFCKITKNNITHKLVFDAITDEGDGPTSYVIDSQSDAIFRYFGHWERIGKLKFNKFIIETLEKQ